MRDDPAGNSLEATLTEPIGLLANELFLIAIPKCLALRKENMVI